MEPAVVLVSGAPGAGKTTLAGQLSLALGLPLIAKDVIKERLVATLPPPPPSDHDPLTWSRLVGGAAMDVLWVLANQPVTVMIEANFRPRSSIERERLTALQCPVIEVHCWCPPTLAAERYARRARSGARDPRTHVVTALTDEMLAEFDTPMGLGELVTVDTSGPVDIGRVAGQVRALLTGTVG
ncbi:MAG: ATP-binding protein [Humibacillus sp.]|nr:ATP-binding protein [Humibacillus sp.]MDN5778488.1 ATP-binding protein [Humibacillus sp.]